MNIELQCCGLGMLFFLLLFLREKSLDLTSRRLYMRALISCIICLTMDIGSIVAIYYATYKGWSKLSTVVICKAYLITLILQGYQALLYAASEYFVGGTNRRVRTLYDVLLVVGTAAVVFLPLSYTMQGMVVYSFGPAAISTYLVAAVYIASSISMAFRGVSRISRRRRRCILLWQGMWLLAAAIQFVFPSLLLVGFAAAFGMVLIYAELENSGEGIDRITGLFTSDAMTVYVNDLYLRKKSFAAMHIRIENRNSSIDPVTERSVMLQLSNLLNQNKKASAFHVSGNEFMVIYLDPAQMQADYERIQSGNDRDQSMPYRVLYTLIPDSTVFCNADEFLNFRHYYRNSNQSQDRVLVDDAHVKQIRKYLHTRDMINDALEEGRVEVFFQPIYNVSRKCFTAAEALVRIRERDGTLVPPGSFIPFAEENGLIVPLGFEIFRQVCSFLSTGKAQKLGLQYIEANLSVAQFDNDNPARFVQQTLKEFHVDPDWINLEITETASNNAKKMILQNMEKLIDSGISFSLDDFGTGRSNLDYFVDMPVEIIKFDSSFTQCYFESFKTRCVIESVADLMHRMGLYIVAEGVETKEQFDAMTALNIEYIQGFYFSRPLPADEFLRFLAENNKRKL